MSPGLGSSVVPHINNFFRRCEHVRRCHGDEQWLCVDVFAVHWCPQTVADDQTIGADVVLVLGGQHTVLSLTGH